MCGIAGVHSLKGGVKGFDMERMTAALRHRGPDDEGYAVYKRGDGGVRFLDGDDSVVVTGGHIRAESLPPGGVFLGHRRLSIIDVSPAGHQPMSYGGLTIVFNGEIYNHPELKERLTAKGHSFRTLTDTEVLLAAYMEWGEGCLDMFNGMWSFVILDTGRNMLFGSRDRLGVKPLYYYNKEGYFAFASEIKSLIKLPFVKRGINEGALYDFLVWGRAEHSENTFFDGINKVPPAHFFTYDLASGRLDMKRYYSLSLDDAPHVFDEGEFDRHCLMARRLFVNAVDIRLRSDVPVGSCLSGGLDSSSIVSVISGVLKGRSISQVGASQRVFTACYDDPAVDESRYAGAVVDKTASRWFRVYPTGSELLKDMRTLVYAQDEPFGSTSVYAQYRVMGLARERGVKVMLDGQGGDELFAGYKAYYTAFFAELIKNMRAGRLIGEMYCLGNSPVNMGFLIKGLAKSMAVSLLPVGLLSPVRDAFTPESRHLRKDFVQGFRHRDASARELARRSINDMSRKLITGGHLEALLRFEDRNSMAHGIESRTPFADDRELMDYLFSVPSIYKIKGGWNKALLRGAVGDLLPEEVSKRRDKLGFAVPERKWYKDISEELKEILADGGSCSRYIDTEGIRDDVDGILSRSSDDGVSRLWKFINLVLWKEAFGV